MSGPNDHPENLAVRARRGALLPGESSELERVLEASPELRAAYELGRDFDRVATVQTGDEERVLRFVAAAVKARNPERRSRIRPWRWSWLAAAAVLGVCSIAFALRAVWWPQSSRAAAPTSSSVDRSRAARARGRSGAESSHTLTAPPASPSANRVDRLLPPALAPAPAGSSPVARAESVIARDTRARAQPAQALPHAAATGPVQSTNDARSTAAFALEPAVEPNAAALLRQANTARRLGQLDGAVTLLQELEQRFPDSAEAHVSLVSLGKLLMLRGTPSAALARFSSYLAAGGPLEEEALVGRAQALAALNRVSEERATWQTLLVRFPGSVYSGQARERLQALTQGAPE